MHVARERLSAEDLLDRASELGASDIHLEPSSGGVRIRVRIDGRFVELSRYPMPEAGRLVGRLKVLAGLMVYRSDVPQEGRIVRDDGREARMCVIPSVAGESVTIRVFDASIGGTLGELGMPDSVLTRLRAALVRGHGLVVVSGPSGSGKTTTLYACLAEILRERGEFCHVTSIEDPVERQLAGVVQVQVDPIRQLGFAEGLKFLLRQDPEVVMVGEVRDAETAAIAVRAGMTGHLVLTTLHCGRAADTRARLLEMGVERYAVDLALSGTVAQRLLRRTCEACAGSGCVACFASGFSGRVAVAEWSDGTESGGTAARLPTLIEAARVRVEQGLTTTSEVTRVLGDSDA
jgi:type II secretory ATPase GspE/PulE/Tfp pilus assembly ATPase PilB-like protein